MKSIRAILMLVVVVGTLASCQSKKEQRYEASFLGLFDTVTKVVGYAKSKEEFSNYTQMIYDELEKYHQLYDIYHDYEGINNLKTINDHGAEAPVKVDQAIIDLLLLSNEAYDLSGGRINIAYGSVLTLWHDYRSRGIDDPENAQLPPMEELIKRNEHTNMDDLIIDEVAKTVYLKDPEMSLDVGAIGKGYATEKVSQYIEAQGFKNGMLSVGGNVRTIGGKLEGNREEYWNVGIQNPDLESEEKTIYILKLKDYSLVTSGVYERYYRVKGERYHHIIDPETLMPSDQYQSVSVVCRDSGMADALTTILFNMSYEEGLGLIESMEDTEALWIMKDGSRNYSNGFKTFIKE